LLKFARLVLDVSTIILWRDKKATNAAIFNTIKVELNIR